MLKVTLPRKPVPPMRNMRRSLKMSVGESLFVMIENLLAQLTGAPGSVVLQQVDHLDIVSANGYIEWGAVNGQRVHVRAAQQKLFDDRHMSVIGRFSQGVAAVQARQVNVGAF